MAYHTNAGPAYGALCGRAGSGAVDATLRITGVVLFGTATEIVSPHGGASLWRPTVHGVELPGLYVVIDRDFWSAR
jgi:hypothetical protein